MRLSHTSGARKISAMTTEEYTLTVGMEVHAELNTKSKMFCGCLNAPHESEVNSNVCPVCTAQPGALPTPNETAIQKVLLVGRALGAELAEYSEFDRKNYFYPDIPKAYQLSQYAFPFVRGGELAGVTLTRIHLEEDTARSSHEAAGASIVDFNRAGVPLMELVTEPVITSSEQAGVFAKELQLLLRTLDVSHANMERGEMRVEANISVSKTGELGTKVEVKNLNSFKSVEAAIAYEFDRQVAALEKGEEIVQETRGWDENNSKTFSQRSKETAEDYRYFPDPDLAKLFVPEYATFTESRLSEITPELPQEKREKYTHLGLPRDQIEILLNNPEAEELFKAVVNTNEALAKAASNYITSDALALREEAAQAFSPTAPEQFVGLMEMVVAEEIGSRIAKDLLPKVLFDEIDPKQYAKEHNLLQLSSADDMLPMVQQIIAENPDAVAEYKAGKEAALQYLVGQGMKLSKGSANPKVLAELLGSELTA